MRARRRLNWLLGVATIGCAAMAAFGVATLADDADRAEARYRAQAAAALDAGRAALAEAVRALPFDQDEALPFLVAPDGELLEPSVPRPSSRPAPNPDSEDGAALVELLELETARLHRLSGPAAAAARLREIAARADAAEGADVRPWALTALAAVERAAGRVDEARKAWRAIVSDHPDARDARGVKRSHVARLLLAESGADDATTADLLALHDAVSSDGGPTPSSSHVWLLDRVAEAARKAGARETNLLAAERARLDDVAARERLRARAHAFIDAWALGAAEWVASGAEGGARAFAAENGPALIAALDPSAASGNRRGAALELDRLAARALETPAVASFASIGLRVVVGPTIAIDGKLLDSNLPAPWPEGVRAAVVGDDLAGFRETERRKFLLGAGLAAFALLVAVCAAVATVRAVDREVRAARDREGFVAATTHELKTPLAAIKLLAELLPDPKLDLDKRVEFANRIGAEADRLARLVASVLDFARLERSSVADLRARFAPLDLGATFRSVVETFRPMAVAGGFEVVYKAPPDGPQIVGDADALGGALLNLLDNAVKYGGAPHVIEVEVGAADPDGRVAARVADRGPGVGVGDRGRIFEPFVRVGDELVRERKGVGLGLALVTRVAEIHGGRAFVAPRPGGGSVFVFEIAVDGGAYDPGRGRTP